MDNLNLIEKHASTILSQENFSWLTVGEVAQRLENEERNNDLITKHADAILSQPDFSWLTVGEVAQRLEDESKE